MSESEVKLRVARSQEKIDAAEILVNDAIELLNTTAYTWDKSVKGSTQKEVHDVSFRYSEVIEEAVKLYRQLGRSTAYLSMYLARFTDDGEIMPMNELVRPLFEDTKVKEEKVGKMPRLPSLDAQIQNDRPSLVSSEANELNISPPLSESEALEELTTFLDEYIQHGSDERQRAEAVSIRHSLNFIGQQELDRATKGMAEKWQTYLDEDTNRQILVVLGATEDASDVKSDSYVLEKILTHIDSKASLENYAGRIVTEKSQLTAAPEDARVTFLDDWSISGEQLGKAYANYVNANPHDPYKQRIVVDLVVASPQMIKDGFHPAEYAESAPPDQILPVEAHFVAKPRYHESQAGDQIMDAHCTGSHSTVDFGYGNALRSMAYELTPEGEELNLPTLARVARPYSKATLLKVAELRGLNQEEISK